jgi:gamma-glutamylcyclotransferase (GGCT)/AIG2-like uncharacterized protein YtfP
MSKLYLAYGSNLNRQQMAHRCPTAKVVGTTFLEGYKLLFRGPHAGAVATVEPSKDDKVPVMIWEIQDRDEAALDVYEGFPRLYTKETVKVKLGRKMTEVMMYVMTEGRPLNLPNAYYYGTILHGYKGAKFDKKFLDDGVERSRTTA